MAPLSSQRNYPVEDALHEKRGRILVITNIPTPYRLPLFRELATQLDAHGYSLKVVFGALGYSRRRWKVNLDNCGFEYEILPSRSVAINRSESVILTYPRLSSLLARERPRAVVVTGYSLATVKLWLHSWFSRVPYVIWSGAIANPLEPMSYLRTLERRQLVSRAAAFIAYGSRARDYLISVGASEDRVRVGINTVDTEFFSRETAACRGDGIGPEVLFVGDLTPRKGVDLLLPAFARVARSRPEAILTLVGDGPEYARLVRQAAEYGIARQVRFEGYRQTADLPVYLRRARCLAFPTRFDIWGLVLPEAMAARVPCVASTHAGATADLIQDGVTGFRVDFTNTDEAAARLAWMLDQPGEALRMGEAASAFVRGRASLVISAAGFVEAVETAVGGAKR